MDQDNYWDVLEREIIAEWGEQRENERLQQEQVISFAQTGIFQAISGSEVFLESQPIISTDGFYVPVENTEQKAKKVQYFEEEDLDF
jgi:hypothetical protein